MRWDSRFQRVGKATVPRGTLNHGKVGAASGFGSSVSVWWNYQLQPLVYLGLVALVELDVVADQGAGWFSLTNRWVSFPPGAIW